VALPQFAKLLYEIIMASDSLLTVISAEDVSALQSDLGNLVAWSKEEWQMLFNVK